jgi:hypothetical protein
MPTKFRDEFVDRLLAEGAAMGGTHAMAEAVAKASAEGWAKGWAEGWAKGRAEGSACVILRVLAARGVEVPADVREQVLSCTDIGQFDIWADRAATAVSVEKVFGI